MDREGDRRSMRERSPRWAGGYLRAAIVQGRPFIGITPRTACGHVDANDVA